MAECPSCGARTAIGLAGARWSLRSPEDVADRLCAEMASLEREEMRVLVLNARNGVIVETVAYIGNVSACVVRVAELFTEAVRRSAPRIVLVHNHPSGDVTPSPDDLHLTAEAIAAGRLLDIEVLDSVIIGSGGSYASLRQAGTAFDR